MENSLKADAKDPEEESKLLTSTGKARTAAEGGLTTTVAVLANATAALEALNSDFTLAKVTVMRQ